MESIQKNANIAQKGIRKKIRWEVGISIAVYILILPLAFYEVKLLFLLPVAAAIWVWYLWEIRRLYSYDNESQNIENVKNFLLGKEKLITNYIRRTLYIAYFATPIIWAIMYATDIVQKSEKSGWIGALIVLIIMEITVIFITKFYIKKFYAPILDEIKSFLEEFNGNNQ